MLTACTVGKVGGKLLFGKHQHPRQAMLHTFRAISREAAASNHGNKPEILYKFRSRGVCISDGKYAAALMNSENPNPLTSDGKPQPRRAMAVVARYRLRAHRFDCDSFAAPEHQFSHHFGSNQWAVVCYQRKFSGRTIRSRSALLLARRPCAHGPGSRRRQSHSSSPRAAANLLMQWLSISRVPVPDEFERYFDAAEAGRYDEMKAIYKSTPATAREWN